jgi:hypothetical protein
MFKISASSKYRDNSGTRKLYTLLAITSVLTVVIFVITNYNIFISLGILGVGIMLYISLSRSPKTILILADDKHISIDGYILKWENCVGWAINDLGDKNEFVIQTTKLSDQYHYFYFIDKQPGVKEFIKYITQYLPYLPEISDKNIAHEFLRGQDLI